MKTQEDKEKKMTDKSWMENIDFLIWEILEKWDQHYELINQLNKEVSEAKAENNFSACKNKLKAIKGANETFAYFINDIVSKSEVEYLWKDDDIRSDFINFLSAELIKLFSRARIASFGFSLAQNKTQKIAKETSEALSAVAGAAPFGGSSIAYGIQKVGDGVVAVENEKRRVRYNAVNKICPVRFNTEVICSVLAKLITLRFSEQILSIALNDIRKFSKNIRTIFEIYIYAGRVQQGAIWDLIYQLEKCLRSYNEGMRHQILESIPSLMKDTKKLKRLKGKFVSRPQLSDNKWKMEEIFSKTGIKSISSETNECFYYDIQLYLKYGHRWAAWDERKSLEQMQCRKIYVNMDISIKVDAVNDEAECSSRYTR